MSDDYKKAHIEKIINEFKENTKLLVNRYNIQKRQIIMQRTYNNKFLISNLNNSLNEIYKASWNDLQRKIKIIEQSHSIPSNYITSYSIPSNSIPSNSIIKYNNNDSLVNNNYIGTNIQLNNYIIHDCINYILIFVVYNFISLCYCFFLFFMLFTNINNTIPKTRELFVAKYYEE